MYRIKSASFVLTALNVLVSGNCESDEDCAQGLVCWERSLGEETRAWGCAGVGGSGLAEMNVCLMPEDMPTNSPTRSPTMKPTYPYNQLLFVGDNNSPPDVFPLQQCQGLYLML